MIWTRVRIWSAEFEEIEVRCARRVLLIRALIHATIEWTKLSTSRHREGLAVVKYSLKRAKNPSTCNLPKTYDKDAWIHLMASSVQDLINKSSTCATQQTTYVLSIANGVTIEPNLTHKQKLAPSPSAGLRLINNMEVWMVSLRPRRRTPA